MIDNNLTAETLTPVGNTHHPNTAASEGSMRRLAKGILPLLCAIVFSLAAPPAFAQTVTTDQLSYQPGEVVTITGQGWQPHESVFLRFASSAKTRPTVEVEVPTEWDGSFRDASLILAESDRDDPITVTAYDIHGSEVTVAINDGLAPGSLRCSPIFPFDGGRYGLWPQQTVLCTIEGATDLSPEQQSGIEPVAVLVRSSTQGSRPATDVTVTGTNITFKWTAPINACGNAVVSYGPIRACDPGRKRCAMLPPEANDANGASLSGKRSTAEFAYLTVNGSMVPCPSPPQLMVETSPQNGGFSQGSRVGYRIVVSNPAPAGSAPAKNVKLTDVLPGNGGLFWEGAVATRGTCVTPIANNLLECSLGDIYPQESVTVKVESSDPTALQACQWQPNPQAEATADGGLYASGSGSLTCTVPPPKPGQLSVTVSPKDGTFTQGSQAGYTIVVSNPAPSGADPAANVRLTDHLPSKGGLEWVHVATTAGNCNLAGNNLTCWLGDLPAGDSVTVTVSTPEQTPPSACQAQPNPAATATADGGLSAQEGGLLNCVPPQQTPTCTLPGNTIANTPWKKFAVPPGTAPVVWVHAHIGKPTGLSMTTKSTLLFTGGSLTVNGTSYPLPDGMVIFDPEAPAKAATTFNPTLGRWETVANPKYLNDETFFTGAAIPATAEMAIEGKAAWSFSTATDGAPLSFRWQWSAAAFTYWPGDWNEAAIQAYHAKYHAGVPLNPAVQKSATKGPRGDAGADFTGAWSANSKGGTCP